MGAFRTKYTELNEKGQFNSLTVFTILLTSQLVREEIRNIRFIAKIQHHPKVGNPVSYYKKGTITFLSEEVDVRFDMVLDEEDLQFEVWLLLGVRAYLSNPPPEVSRTQKKQHKNT